MAKTTLPKWYYDANALDVKEVFVEITKKHRANETLISFLALGEAYGNNFNKSDELAESFVELIGKLRDHIKIITNEGTNGILKELMETFPRLDAADALHLATAIHNNCEMIRSGDKDIYGIPEKKLSEFCGTVKKGPIFLSRVKIK